MAIRSLLRRLPIKPWTERLALQWGFRYRPAPTIVKLRSGALIYVDPADYLQLLIYYLGTFEPHCLSYLRSCVGPGATVIDVGANIGLYTLEGALAVGPTGRVISIEAAPSNASALRKNIQLNGNKNVLVLDVAVGDSIGQETLTLAHEANLGMFTLGAGSGDTKYCVEVRPIDDLLATNEINSVDLIKMDIEGSEYRALRGAERTLRSQKPTILIELNESALRRSHSSTSQVKELLFDAGYRGWIIERQGISPLPAQPSIQDCIECLFIHRDNQELIRKLGLSQRAEPSLATTRCE